MFLSGLARSQDQEALPRPSRLSGGLVVSGVSWVEWTALPLASVELSAGPLAERKGYDVVLTLSTCLGGDTGERRSAVGVGVGEVAPLPGFHSETLSEATAALEDAANAIVNTPLPAGIVDHFISEGRVDSAALACAVDAWLDAAVPSSGVATAPGMLSVRSGLEQALVHALARASGNGIADVLAAAAAGFSQGRSFMASPVNTNTLFLRNDGSAGSGAGSVAKVKVGGGASVGEDASRVAALSEARPFATLRLDVNQAWTAEEARNFWAQLPPAVRRRVEYVEEPLKRDAALAEGIESLRALSNTIAT